MLLLLRDVKARFDGVSARARAHANLGASARAAYASRRRRRRRRRRFHRHRRRKAVPISKVIAPGHANDCDMDANGDEDRPTDRSVVVIVMESNRDKKSTGGASGEKRERPSGSNRGRERYCTVAKLRSDLWTIGWLVG